MKDYVNDSLWFRSPDGGEVKISLAGFPPKEVERLKALLKKSGWEFVSHSHESNVRNPFLSPNALWFFLGGSFGAIITSFFWSALTVHG